MKQPTLYFDHCASTPPHPDVIRTFSEIATQVYANASSLHDAGGKAEQLVHRARIVIAHALQAKPEEMIFTSGATESNNLAILGTVKLYATSLQPVHIITTEVEHASVYECYKQLERTGIEVTYLPVDKEGYVCPQHVEAAICKHTVLVSVMHVNHETGTVQPLAEIGQRLQRYPNIRFHVDGVQGLGKILVSLSEWGVDLYSLSGHKIGGLKGIGLLYKRKSLSLQPLLFGGQQQDGLRPGTENVPGIVALAKAIRLAVEGLHRRQAKLLYLRTLLLQGLQSMQPLIVNSLSTSGAPHIVNVSFSGIKAEVIVHMLEQQGIIVATQSACSSKLHAPSRILWAMTRDVERAVSGIRISLDEHHTEEDIYRLRQAFQATISQLLPFVQRRSCIDGDGVRNNYEV